MLENNKNCPHLEEGWCFYCVQLWQEAYSKGKKEGLVRKTGYMCATDYEYELNSASGGCKIYASEADLKSHSKCWVECGIVKVELILTEEKYG